MNVLSLGAGGFVGAHLTKRLLNEGHDVLAVDTQTDKIRDLLDHPHLVVREMDIRGVGPELADLVGEADLVVDLIAYANPGLYVKMPLEVFRLNFEENLRIAEACVSQGTRLLQFSSSEVYGKTPAHFLADKLLDPDDPELATFSEETSAMCLGPVSRHRWIYACAKQLLERVLHAYGLEGKLQYTVIRPFNFIGPMIDYLPGETGEVPRVFSCFMDALLTGKPMQLVEGGTHRRCYTYIDDAIECIYRIVENRDGVCDGLAFNIGSPQNEVSIGELAELMRTIYHERVLTPHDVLPEPVTVSAAEFYGEGYEDSDRRIPDITRARTLLDWEPITGLREMLECTMAYYIDAPDAQPAAVATPVRPN